MTVRDNSYDIYKQEMTKNSSTFFDKQLFNTLLSSHRNFGLNKDRNAWFKRLYL